MQSCGKLYLSLVISDCSGGGHGHAAAAGARAGPGGRPGLAGGGHTVGEVCGDAAPRVFGFVTSVPGWQDSVARGRQLRGAWLHSAVEERCGLGFTGCEVTRDSSGNVIIKPQIRKNITITKYKMVKQEQGSLVFNLQVPEVPPSGQQKPSGLGHRDTDSMPV